MLNKVKIAIDAMGGENSPKKIIDGLGPDGISSFVISISRNVSKIQTGYVYHYAFAMLIGLGFLLIRFVVY